jgi:hypothetical protein
MVHHVRRVLFVVAACDALAIVRFVVDRGELHQRGRRRRDEDRGGELGCSGHDDRDHQKQLADFWRGQRLESRDSADAWGQSDSRSPVPRAGGRHVLGAAGRSCSAGQRHKRDFQRRGAYERPLESRGCGDHVALSRGGAVRNMISVQRTKDVSRSRLAVSGSRSTFRRPRPSVPAPQPLLYERRIAISYHTWPE